MAWPCPTALLGWLEWLTHAGTPSLLPPSHGELPYIPVQEVARLFYGLLLLVNQAGGFEGQEILTLLVSQETSASMETPPGQMPGAALQGTTLTEEEGSEL